MGTNRFLLAVRKLPFANLFCDSSRESIAEAVNEAVWATLFASLPLWFVPLLGAIFLKHGTSINSEINSGEAFIYSEAIIGPLTYILYKRYGSKDLDSADAKKFAINLSHTFPYGNFFFSFSIGLSLLNVGGITFLKVFQNLFPAANVLNLSGVFYASWFSLITTTALSFLVSISKSTLENIIRLQQKEEQAFADAWRDQKHDS